MIDDTAKHFGILTGVGALIGLGQLLASTEVITKRLFFGRLLVSGGFGLASGAALSFVPDLPLVALAGIAAAISSMGLSAVEFMVRRLTGGA